MLRWPQACGYFMMQSLSSASYLYSIILHLAFTPVISKGTHFTMKYSLVPKFTEVFLSSLWAVHVGCLQDRSKYLSQSPSSCQINGESRSDKEMGSALSLAANQHPGAAVKVIGDGLQESEEAAANYSGKPAHFLLFLY